MSMSLSRDFLKRFMKPVFVETGTFDGRGCLLAKEVGFKVVHSIELDPSRVFRSREILFGIEGVAVHEGDTIVVLPNLLSTLEEKATIFLDAHPVGEGDNCKIGKYRHPLVHELFAIRDFSKRKDHTIIVDDRHDFHIYKVTDEEIIEILKSINPAYNARLEGDHVVAEVHLEA